MRKRKFKPGDKVRIFCVTKTPHDYNIAVNGRYGVVHKIEARPKAHPLYGRSTTYKKTRSKIRGTRYIFHVSLNYYANDSICGVHSGSDDIFWKFVFCGEASIEELVTHIDSDIRDLGRKQSDELQSRR